MLFITTPGEENKIYLSRGKRAWIDRVNPPLFWEIDKQCWSRLDAAWFAVWSGSPQFAKHNVWINQTADVDWSNSGHFIRHKWEIRDVLYPNKRFYDLQFYVPVSSYGHVGTVSSPNKAWTSGYKYFMHILLAFPDCKSTEWWRMTVEIKFISWSIFTKVSDRAGIKLTAPLICSQSRICSYRLRYTAWC